MTSERPARVADVSAATPQALLFSLTTTKPTAPTSPTASAAELAESGVNSAESLVAAIDALGELFFTGDGACRPLRLPGKISTVEDLLDAGGLEAVCAALQSAPDYVNVQVRGLAVAHAWQEARITPFGCAEQHSL